VPLAPSTSLIISTRGRPAFLSAAVAAVQAGRVRPTELVLVDQSEEAHPSFSAARMEGPTPLRYLWSRDRGLSRGRNAGIAAATGEILVFIDDDILVPPDWLGTIVDALVASGPRCVMTGRVVAGPAEVAGAFAPSLSLSEEAVTYHGRVGRDVLLPMNMAMYRSVVDEIGDFDVRLGVGSHFPSSEDNDFGFRLLEAGYRIVYRPDIVVTHRAWRRPSALIPLRWSYGRGQGAYFAKHVSRRDRYMLRRLWWDVTRHVRRAPRRMVRDPRQGAADLVYATAVAVGAAEWLVTRRGR
jgi:GT2 family glycosyltransferase